MNNEMKELILQIRNEAAKYRNIHEHDISRQMDDTLQEFLFDIEKSARKILSLCNDAEKL